MSALRHGFFRRGFMLCDRCILNVRCESFVPGGDCGVEKQAYDWVVSELMEQYGLQGVADEVSVGRVAMYLIRIVRAEVYEANVGVSDAFAAWGKYVMGLDNNLRRLLRDLALTRKERMKAEKDDVLVDVDRLLNGLARKSMVKAKAARFSVYRFVLKDWVAEKKRLSLH
ncbi:MAG: hypothetical protein ACPLRY_05285 [Candidatus Bathyarchaeales archaeon]